MNSWQFVDFGILDFGEFLTLQDRVWRARLNDSLPDSVLFAEHPPTISFGARPRDQQLKFLRVPPEELALRNIPIFETQRGGSLSLHAPGILGCYIIMKTGASIIPSLLRLAQEVFMEFGIKTNPTAPVTSADAAKYRGAWTAHGKIASVGVNNSRGVTRFGANFNISADPALLTLIHPCGIEEYLLTTLALEGVPATITEVKEVIRGIVPHVF